MFLDESDYELEYETVSRTELWFEEHVPLDFNFHTAQVHLNDFLTRLRRDQKLFEEIDDIDPNLDKGPLTEHELFLARKAKKEKELMKEIEQHEDIINVKRKKSNPSHSDSEDSCNHEDEVDKHTTDVKKIIDVDEELKEEERVPEECRNLPELNSLIRVEQFIEDLPSSAGYSCRNIYTQNFNYLSSIWLPNRLISAGLERVLGHAEKSCIVSYYTQKFIKRHVICWQNLSFY